MRIIVSVFVLLFTFSFTFSQEDDVLAVGEMAPPIELKTITDDDFSLTSLKGKVVLIDFWASWCSPCIKEQPELIQLYNEIEEKFGLNQFEILGVSLDMEKKDWERAVERFKIPWPQVSDLKFWRSEVAADYKLQGIPYNVIIDKEGKIIALNLHGDELTDFIKKQLQ